ncbi:hypothetical protein [Streptomyces sp. NPDC055005]
MAVSGSPAAARFGDRAAALGAVALRDGEILNCLTDGATRALGRSGIVLNAVAPATLQNRGDQARVRMPPSARYLRLDLTDAVVTEGGLTLRQPADGHRRRTIRR